MSVPSSGLPRTLLLAATLALAAGACTDDAPSPTAAAPRAGGPSLTTAAEAGGPRRIPNSVKYRDRGLKPATGRSGSATLSVQALQARDGQTSVEVSTGEIGEWWWWAPGNISRLQLKAMQPDGKQIGVLNRNALAEGGRQTVSFAGLGRGTRLQVQANVEGIDPNRTDVVTVTETVKLRPDLAVRLSAPARVRAGAPVNLLATVSELNGDVGARAECELYVDGSLVDWSWGVWVDAGDAVTCAFTPTFNLNGTRTVEVRATSVSPADYAPANNTASATLEVSGGSDFIYSAYANETADRWYSLNETRWHNALGDSGSYRREQRDDSHRQYASLHASMPRAVRNPLTRVELSQTTGGRTVHAAVLEDVGGYDWGGGYFCSDWWYGEAGTFFYLCSGEWNGGWTDVTYSRNAGTVTYFSSFYERVWDNYTGSEYFYAYNYASADAWGGALLPYGDDYAITVRLTDGDTTWSASPVISLSGWEYQSNWPHSCYSYQEPWEPRFTSEWCTTTEWSFRDKYGWASSGYGR